MLKSRPETTNFQTRCKNESTLAWISRQGRAEALHTLLTTVIRMEAKQYADIGQTTSSGKQRKMPTDEGILPPEVWEVSLVGRLERSSPPGSCL